MIKISSKQKRTPIKKGIDPEEGKLRREDDMIKLRKTERDNRVAKRRQQMTELPTEGMVVSCCGWNEGCILGCSLNLIKRSTVFRTVPNLPRNIVSVAASSLNSLAVTGDGHVYSWGVNDNGQCGQPSEIETVESPTLIKINEKIIGVDAGATHCLALSSDGNIHFFGSYRNSYDGKECCDLGVNEKDPPPSGRQYLPTKIFVPEKVVKIACGSTFNAALLESGRCLTWGLNLEGELGRITEGNVDLNPTEVAWYDDDKLAKPNVQRKVLDIACGGNHILVVAARDGSSESSSSLYGSGNNEYGQLGLDCMSSLLNAKTALDETNVLLLTKVHITLSFSLSATRLKHFLLIQLFKIVDSLF